VTHRDGSSAKLNHFFFTRGFGGLVVICILVEGQINLKKWLTTETLRILLLGRV
jgi:hypothetical protein